MIRVLVPLDGSQIAEEALAHASAIARSFRTKIYLLQVIGNRTVGGGIVNEAADLRMQAAQARTYLEGIQAAAGEKDIHVDIYTEEGKPAEQIIAFAKSHDIDLIALTAYGKGGVTEFVHGSTVHKVISRAGVSILLVRPKSTLETQVRYKKLLVPLDGSYRTDWALCLATSIARAHKAELVLMHVIQTPKPRRHMPASRTERELLERLEEIHKSDAAHHLRELDARLPADVTRSCRVVVVEEAARVIESIAQSEDVGLLVLSAHGLSDADCWLYGPVSETLLAHSTQPLLVLQDNLSSSKVEFEPLTDLLAASG